MNWKAITRIDRKSTGKLTRAALVRAKLLATYYHSVREPDAAQQAEACILRLRKRLGRHMASAC